MSSTAGSAAAGACDQPRSISAIVGDTATGHHLLLIDGYSCTKELLPTGKCTESQPFSAAGCSWRIHYYPNGQTSKHAEFISVFLRRDGSAGDGGENVKARAKFSLLDREGRPVESNTSTTDLRGYSIGGSAYGFTDFIEREILEKSDHLFCDCLRISCDITVFKELRTEHRAAASPLISKLDVPPSDLSQHLGDLLCLVKEGVSDVTFQVAGETFKAHRYILAARSPVFKAELLGKMRESTSKDDDYIIQIDDMLAAVFKVFLHFVYTDSLPEMEGQEEAVVMAQHLLEAADRYDMKRLKLICEDRLCRHLDVTTAATTLVLAEQHNCHGLKEACIEFIKSPHALEQVMATDGFEHLTKTCPALIKELMSKRRKSSA